MSASPMYRDTTAAQLARLDMASVRRRLDIATKMIGEGATVDAIQAATKLATGTAIGGSSLTRLRRQLKRQAAAKPKPVATARPEPAATPDVLALAMRPRETPCAPFGRRWRISNDL